MTVTVIVAVLVKLAICELVTVSVTVLVALATCELVNVTVKDIVGCWLLVAV